jgi:hypothetical protein
MGPTKASGPDGIPAIFNQHFFHSGHLLKPLNQYFIDLIPKVYLSE